MGLVIFCFCAFFWFLFGCHLSVPAQSNRMHGITVDLSLKWPIICRVGR